MASTHRDEISRLELLHAAHPDGLVFPHLADAYRRAGRYAQAESVLNAGLRRHADFSSAHVVMGRLRLDQGKRAEAQSAFHRVLQLDPDNPVALEHLGHLAAEEGRVGEALTYLRRLARQKPSQALQDRIADLEQRARALRSGRIGSGSDGDVGGPDSRRRGTAARPGPPSGQSVVDAEEAPLPPLPEPGEVVTETMAELYSRQGLHQRAEAVYRKLYERDPSNTRLRAKLEEARARRVARAEPGERHRSGPAPDVARERPREPGAPAPGDARVLEPSEPSAAEADATESAGGSGRQVYPWTPSQSLLAPLESVSGQGPSRARPDPTIRSYLRGVLDWSSGDGSTAESAPEPTPSAASRWRRRQAPPRFEPEVPTGMGSAPQAQALIALTDLLVGLLEYRDPFFRGSSSLTRLLATSVARELGLGASESAELALAAVLRDLGRLAMGGRLVEPPKSDSPEGRRKIERHVDLALQLLEGITLPKQVKLAVRHHHEWWDGGGYPDGLAGEEIPLMARILAVVDSFAAMVSPRPYRLPKKVRDAEEELQSAAGTQYDPAMVAALLRVVARRDQPHLAFVQRHHILLVNPDQPGAVVTAAKLCTAGYLAELAVDPDVARERLRRVPVAALVVSARAGASEVESLVRELRLDPLFASLPIVVVDAETVALRVQLLESGADVCFPPEISYAELQGTLGALVRRTLRTREVSPRDHEEAPWLALQGDLQDFPLAWLLQVMKYDSRTAGVGIRTATDQGAIYIDGGDVIHAQVRGGAVGEPALKEMLRWDKGRFTVQPDARSHERSIDTSIMHLLLTQAVEQDHAARGIFGAVSDHG